MIFLAYACRFTYEIATLTNKNEAFWTNVFSKKPLNWRKIHWHTAIPDHINKRADSWTKVPSTNLINYRARGWFAMTRRFQSLKPTWMWPQIFVIRAEVSSLPHNTDPRRRSRDTRQGQIASLWRKPETELPSWPLQAQLNLQDPCHKLIAGSSKNDGAASLWKVCTVILISWNSFTTYGQSVRLGIEPFPGAHFLIIPDSSFRALWQSFTRRVI
jgi:hypothetical protein